MKKLSETIIFFGSGPVAADSLAFLASIFEIECVITKQASSHHRGSVPVLEQAQKLGLSLQFANNRQELNQLLSEVSFSSRLGVVVDYGVIVSQKIIDSFPLGIINSHFSLLPEWRGADPITFSVLSGQKETGVCLMLIVEQLDAGQLIAQERVALAEDITTPELTDQLIEKSNQMLSHYLPLYLAGNIKPYDQPDLPATFSRKLTKADGLIDWTKPAVQLEREIRAFAGWPRSTTTLADKSVIVTKARIIETASQPGRILENKGRLVIAAGDNALEIIRLKPAGKPEMTAQAFLAGHPNLK